MMAKPQADNTVDICPLCKRLKSQHTPEQMKFCMKKLQEFNKQDHGGAGIQ